jgi:hypothetical protein
MRHNSAGTVILDAITLCTYNRFAIQSEYHRERTMQNFFAGVDVERTQIKVALVGPIETRPAANSVSITAAGIGSPGRIDFTSGRLSCSGASWSSLKVSRWPCSSTTDSRVPSPVTTTSTRSWLARCGSAQVAIAHGATQLQIQAAPHRSARRSRFQIAKACALAGCEMLNACVPRAC